MTEKIIITGGESVETLLERHPGLQTFLQKKGIVCVECGTAFWGPLNDLAEYSGWDQAKVENLIRELNDFLNK